MAESVQQLLSRVRKPRVHITFDVETGGAKERRELPFVVGVMANLSGSKSPEKSLGDRKFTQIDPDNFTDFLAAVGPEASFKVNNVLADDDSTIPVDLKFKSLDDFGPAAIAEQVAPLKQLVEVRNRLRDLLTRIDRSEELEALLSETLQSSDDIKQLSGELEAAGVDQGSESEDTDAPADTSEGGDAEA